MTFLIRDPNTGILGPGLFTLINFKNEVGYRKIFAIIKHIIYGSVNDKIKLQKVTVDFEDSLQNTVKEIFCCEIVGCLFHFRQAINRKLKSIGLQSLDKDQNTIINDLIS